ncbi:MAG: hypothetical protein H6Q65_1247 [Firmicutes bacterium]|nr:hypothetical protein [Bacillota bacterium]
MLISYKKGKENATEYDKLLISNKFSLAFLASTKRVMSAYC